MNKTRSTTSICTYFRMPLFFWLSFSFARGSQASSTEFPFLWGLTSVFFPVPGKPRKNIKGDHHSQRLLPGTERTGKKKRNETKWGPFFLPLPVNKCSSLPFFFLLQVRVSLDEREGRGWCVWKTLCSGWCWSVPQSWNNGAVRLMHAHLTPGFCVLRHVHMRWHLNNRGPMAQITFPLVSYVFQNNS